MVVTGGARGIGRGCAELLAREGARVVIADRDSQAGEATAAAIRAVGQDAHFHQTDVTNEEQCAALMTATVDAYGRIDGLVNNAGWFPRGTLEETSADLWDQVIAINLRSAFFCCKHAVPHMRVAGGSIVNMGSPHGIQGMPNLVAYSAAKGGLLSLTRTLAGAYAHDRIRINYLIPGWVLTEAEIDLQHRRGMSDDDLQRAGAGLPLGRHQTVEDLAFAALYLLSDEAAQVTGAVLNIDAGASTLPIYKEGNYVG